MQKNENNIKIYQDEDVSTKISVKFSDEDLWLTKYQVTEIYKTTRQNIEQHIDNIYKVGELQLESTCKFKTKGVGRLREILTIII